MSVSGNEEPGVLSRRSSDISAGIPIKKRRFLLDSHSFPPRHEPALPSIPEVNEIKTNEDSSLDLENKEKDSSDCKETEESRSELKNKKEEYGEDVVNKEDSGSVLANEVESLANSKGKEGSFTVSDQGPLSRDVPQETNGISDMGKVNLLEVEKEIVSAPSVSLSNLHMDVSGPKLPGMCHLDGLGSADRVESKKESLLTGKVDASEVRRTTGGTLLVSVKKEMQGEQADDCNLKLSTVSGNDKKESLVPRLGYQNTLSNLQESVHTSVLSLSLSIAMPILKRRNDEATLGTDGKFACANRSNWDLNTTMDAWEVSIGETARQSNVGGSAKKPDSNNERPSLSSAHAISASSEKGKQVVSTSEPRSSFSTSSVEQTQLSEDSLRLTLSSSFQEMDFGKVLSDLPAKVDFRMDVPNLQSGFISPVDKNASNFRVVKSEPTDDSSGPHPTRVSITSTELLGFKSLEGEPTKKRDIHALNLMACSSSSQKFTEQKCIKSEPTSEVCEDILKTTDFMLQQSVGKLVHSQESGSSSSISPMPLTPPKPSPSRLPTFSELSVSADISNQSEYSVHTKEFHLGTDVQVQDAADMSTNPAYGDRVDNVVADKIDDRATDAKSSDDDSEIKNVKEHLHDLRVNGEGSLSDGVQVNKSTKLMEDEPYDSDYESDNNQAFGSHLDMQNRGVKEDDEFKDGKVLIEDLAADGIEAVCAKLVYNDSPSGFPSDTTTDQCQLDDEGKELKIHDNVTVGCIMENVGAVSSKNCQQLSNQDDSSQIFSSAGMAATCADEQKLSSSYERKSVDQSGKRSSLDDNDKVASSAGASSGCKVVTSEANGEIMKSSHMANKPDSSPSIVETSFNGTNAAKDSTGGGSKSRIISLPRASVTSPSKIRSIPEKLLSSRNGRERYSDLDGEKFFLQGNRDEVATDGPQRYVRERIQDLSFRSSRVNYSRGRARFSGRLDTSRREWVSDRDFALGNYEDYQFTRNKRVAAISDAEPERDDYVIAPDGAALSNVRGRKFLNDDLRSFRHSYSRRFSPGGRDGIAGSGVQMLRRVPRNTSPSRRNDENGNGLIGHWHDDKFVRVLPDDIVDPAFTRSQVEYDGGDAQYMQGNRNFSTFQRRGVPRVRSKSPVGSRTRSPSPWSSPRSRYPDGFNGLSHLAQHRSPPMYGVERIRSPDRSCLPEQIVARRRSSPSYVVRPSNETMDVDSGREHGHPRAINSRRSPTDRVFNRSTRRLDDLDLRIRTNDDEYIGRPVHSGRFQEFHADENNDERRKCGERRGLARSFRPYIGDTDNARYHTNDFSPPLRFCSDADTELVGRGIRERDYDVRMKNRPRVAPRRDQEGSYRHTGQVWHDDGFNEGSGYKRRRF